MKIPYVKMHGCHNDYIYFYNRDGQLPGLSEVDLAKLAIKFSDRKTGLGSDGVIVVEAPRDPNTAVARMKMLNADGSVGKMCGNGIRCVAKLLYENLGPKDSYAVETDSGLRTCYVTDASDPNRFMVRVNMGRPEYKPSEIPMQLPMEQVVDQEFEILDKSFKLTCLSMGNPHCVIEVEDVKNFDVKKYGSALENHEIFPEQVNVEFIEVQADKVIQRTWERGSGETQACGTGACAVGSSLILREKMKSPVEVQLLGGQLIIEWDGANEIWMTGEAVTESSGTLET
jgi:diaminopimelate epimerase